MINFTSGDEMFGYILPEKPELKIKEYELFKAYYCGVCKSIGARHGQISRLALTYDATFLALLLSSISDEPLKIRRESCIAHPFKKRNIIKESSWTDYAADMNILLAYYKLWDDREDERSLPAAFGMVAFQNIFKKLRGKYEAKCGIIEQRLKELHTLEKEGCNSMDQAAEPFARLMEEIIAFPDLCRQDKTEKILKWIGYNMGKWLYILDAFDDLEKDIKGKTYNPLKLQFKYENETITEFKNRIREKVEFNLIYALSEIAKAYQLLTMNKNAGLVENIIFMGMLRKTEQVLEISNCSCSGKDFRELKAP
ncbi:MAG: DUF5685 family protein [Clostridia bacterium]|nr:DUF5685 family protein [Clostridia bacterium]